ncbi:hypothetical protein DFA_11374 [Cavenderia fasciculata]|uniref:FHA domain-containing protein n=1 Tax=Cavenderia fasciculata TaxID=261658 RepID=F4QCN1_CACFS|nr:uncharacterized protein DFA_11374 [Cavenderia fasciculata]EGG13613.1 hypothetical protein DFA_11374 [Cavenderia fasciculata]|eukprot:XP_004350317.1 hypothetical protein DFA_11374 [Cavenderia fasciculata]
MVSFHGMVPTNRSKKSIFLLHMRPFLREIPHIDMDSNKTKECTNQDQDEDEEEEEEESSKIEQPRHNKKDQQSQETTGGANNTKGTDIGHCKLLSIVKNEKGFYMVGNGKGLRSTSGTFTKNMYIPKYDKRPPIYEMINIDIKEELKDSTTTETTVSSQQQTQSQSQSPSSQVPPLSPSPKANHGFLVVGSISVPLIKHTSIIGSEFGCRIRIKQEFVGPKHASVTVTNGKVMLKALALDSPNYSALKVGTDKVACDEEVEIKENQVFYIGEKSMYYSLKKVENQTMSPSKKKAIDEAEHTKRLQQEAEQKKKAEEEKKANKKNKSKKNKTQPRPSSQKATGEGGEEKKVKKTPTKEKKPISFVPSQPKTVSVERDENGIYHAGSNKGLTSESKSFMKLMYEPERKKRLSKPVIKFDGKN